MDPQLTAKITKIVPPCYYTITDIKTNQNIKLQLSPAPEKQSFIHLLKDLSLEKGITYNIIKKTKFKDQYQKASILLNGKDLATLYDKEQEMVECHDETVYEKDEIIECYILKVECLKLKLYMLDHKKFITFYFSQLRLPRVQNSHPKQIWQRAQDYFMNQIHGQFVQIKINGSQTYRDQLNIHGEILRLHDGFDLKEKLIYEGYAQLSKSADQYLSKQFISKYQKVIEDSKNQKRGIWKDEKRNVKGSNQIMEQKYKLWQEWSKNKKKYTEIKNIESELNQIINELKKNSGVKTDPIKSRILLQVFLTIMEDYVTEKNFKNLQDFIKIVINAFVNLQVNLTLHIQNLDFLKYINKIIILLIFYVTQEERLKINNKKMVVELEKIMKIIFKCCFIGNQTFHEKVFDKNKEFEFQKFSFDPANLSGISSFSEYSDYEDDPIKKESKQSKKLSSARTKIRMNSTLLLSHIFRLYSSIVQNHWEICVKPNILTKDFFNYLSTLKISIESSKMSKEEKKDIVNLMRTNFGDYSLVLLIFFQQNKAVKKNALHCMINMIGNFQGRKMIDTTEAMYIEKLLKQTKSSFIPKSFIIFSGLRNALYFMLFSLHHEINIQIIVTTFKALTQLCQQSTLIDKMGFMQGMGLLMSNYISPVLKFQLQEYESQLAQLKTLCIGFLGALVGTQKKWQQMQTEYLMTKGDKNINCCLLQVIELRKKTSKNLQEDKIIQEITKYLMKMSKKYYPALFFEVEKYKSAWNYISQFYLDYPSLLFTNFVEQVFKCHFDQLTLLKNQYQNRKNQQYVEIGEVELKKFLNSFFPIYGTISTVQNYCSLINILTYIEYGRWDQEQYCKAKEFLVHCFQSLQGKSKNQSYPSLQTLKGNPHVRIALIKMLGYMSFCQEFQSPEYSQKAIKSLLQYSKTYKSSNSVVKITWGISNWSNIPQLKECLSKQELQECLDYMIYHGKSDKQKVASNCTRGIGFFISNFSENFQMEQCRSAIIKNLSHSILKVRTNSTKTLRSMALKKLLGKDQNQVQEIVNNLVPILQQNILKNNYHLQTQTLLLIKQLGNPIKNAHMLRIYSHILRDLLSHTTMEYEFSEIRALKQLRKTILCEIVQMPTQIIKSNEAATKQIYSSIESFLIDSQEEFLRQESQNSQILERGFQKGEQALNAVFNIQNDRYDEEKMISTQITLRGMRYRAIEQQIGLLEKIQQMSKALSDLTSEWKELSTMKIKEREVSLSIT